MSPSCKVGTAPLCTKLTACLSQANFIFQRRGLNNADQLEILDAEEDFIRGPPFFFLSKISSSSVGKSPLLSASSGYRPDLLM